MIWDKIESFFGLPPIEKPNRDPDYEKSRRAELGIPENPKTIDDLPMVITKEMTPYITFSELLEWQLITYRDLRQSSQFVSGMISDMIDLRQELEQLVSQIRNKKNNGKRTTNKARNKNRSRVIK